MQAHKLDERTIREHLKTKRNMLFEEFLGNPSNIRLALEIRSIDDWIAETTGTLCQSKSQGSRQIDASR